jgi:tetrapyrrole methylase family protein / MazG family protein
LPPRHKKKKSKPASPSKAKGPKSARRQLAKSSSVIKGKKRYGNLFEDFVAIQARLRAPGGCPWDREQTHQTLKTYLIEEAYEVLDALEHGSPEELTEELGDLLLQVLFHADIAREAGRFDIGDVITAIQDKMIRRHPHVFGNVKADTPDQVLKNWAQLKLDEKKKAGKAAKTPPSALDGVPRSLPALLEAHQLTKKAAHVGFDWETVEGIFEKLTEETSELRQALSEPSRQRREEEIGDLLFVAVNLSRFLGFDPEVALKKSNAKFKSRFQLMEREATQAGQRLADLSKAELEVLWESAKAHELAIKVEGKA